MHLIQQILFIICSLAAIVIFARKVVQMRRNVNLGRDEDISDNKAERWKNMVLLALGQKKMFKRPIPALLHICVYVGFVIINVEILEIFLDGVFGKHRMFAPYLGNLYSYLIGFFEVLAALVLIQPWQWITSGAQPSFLTVSNAPLQKKIIRSSLSS